MTLDDRVLNWVVAHREPWLTDVFTVITNACGLVGMFALTIALTVGLLVRGRRSQAFLVGGAFVSSWLVMNLLKLLFGRERPPFPARVVLEATHSFPSGHAMLSATLATVVAAVIGRLYGRTLLAVYVALGVASLLIGLSRVYLGAHWFTDVLAGWLVGWGWAMLWIRGTARLPHKN